MKFVVLAVILAIYADKVTSQTSCDPQCANGCALAGDDKCDGECLGDSVFVPSLSVCIKIDFQPPVAPQPIQPIIPSRASTMITKSGEYVAIARDNRLFLTNDPNGAHRFIPVVPCLSNAVDTGCVSFSSAERSGWYVRHWAYDLWLESSVNPRNRHIFNVDGSFHIRRDKFCPGYFSFESVNYPNHFIVKDRNSIRGLYINPGGAADYDRSCFNFIEQ